MKKVEKVDELRPEDLEDGKKEVLERERRQRREKKLRDGKLVRK